jgi:hypothetical protein
MKKVIFVLTLLLACIALYLYISRSKTIKQYQAIDIEANKEMEKATANLREDCNMIYHTFNNRLLDSRTHWDASVWAPKALLVKKLSTNTILLIDSLKSRIGKDGSNWSIYNSGEATRLFDSLVRFKAALLETFGPIH